MKKYKVRRGAGGRIAAVVLLALILAAAYLYQSGRIVLPLPLQPAPTLTPEDSAAETLILSLPGRTWYALQLGAYAQEASARQTAGLFRGKGAAGYLYRQELYRVLAAAYESRADAQAVQTRLRAQHGIETLLLEIARPEITLRATGQKAQLSALGDAFSLLDQAADQLSTQSQRIDAGGAKLQTETEFLLSQQETAEALGSRLDSLFGASPHQAVRQIRQILADLSSSLAQARAAGGMTALGAQVKACQLLCICRMAEYSALFTN